MQKRAWPSPIRLTRLLAVTVATILVLIPFHATLTVWLSQFIGQYTLLRLWKEILLLPLGVGAIYLLIQDKKLRRQLTESLLMRLIALYLLVQVVGGALAVALHHVTLQALGYGWVSDTRFLVFFVIVWVIASKSGGLQRRWPAVVFWPAAAVVAFGLLQYFVLPYDFMKYLGYGAATIFPYEDINHNIHYIRVISTLRGANPLGAYLVVVLSLLAALLVRYWAAINLATRNKVAKLGALGAGSVTVLVLTFSRSAWLGLMLALLVLAWASIRNDNIRQRLLTYALVGLLTAGLLALVLRDNVTFQNVFLHTQTHSLVATTSNEGHVSALQMGVGDIIHEPLGRGPGTAGPASAYNSGHPIRIAENYFLQTGQETGLIGLGLFVAINILAARKLWAARRNPLALGLLAALAGITLINCLSHAWADDTLAYMWWGLAAIALV